jgi:septal ring factor EnvC (AmiA/AmiB activator)
MKSSTNFYLKIDSKFIFTLSVCSALLVLFIVLFNQNSNIENLESKIASQSKKIRQQENEISNLESEYEESKEKIENLEGELDDVKSNIYY